MQKNLRCISLDVFDYSNKLLCNLYDSTSDISGQAYEVYMKTQRNGFKELRFKLPSTCLEEEGEVENYRLQYLVSDYRLRLLVKSDEAAIETDWFLISESKVTHAFNKDYDIVASHISQLLKTKNLDLEFSDDEGNNIGTIKEIAETILEGTGWHLGKVATFWEEEKYFDGEKKEKVRTFSASTKTGAFKLMSDLCDLFDAKPIYHGEGTYIENGETKVGRTVDILPMNPFSKDTEPGQIPAEVLEEKKILELHYAKNVKNVTRTLKTENLVTKLSAYGSHGDLNGMCSLQTAEHAVLSFGNLESEHEYAFTFNNATYYFTLSDWDGEEVKWSSLDFVSRSYVYSEQPSLTVAKTYNKPVTNDVIHLEDYTVEYTRNYFPFVMDFTYYQQIGLLTDEMLEALANYQLTMPALYDASEQASIDLTAAKSELMQTASDGEGFLRLDVKNLIEGNNIVLEINTENYPDGIIYRSDYDEAQRNYFIWRPAKGIKTNGEALSAIGSVVYVVRKNNPTKWLKSYVKLLGNEEGYYSYDSLNNKYIKPNIGYYHADEDGDENTLYISQNDNKLYIWNEEYLEVQAGNFHYGTNGFPVPTKIMLWSSEIDFEFNPETDYVFLFSANSIAGLFGPREDAVDSNIESVQKSVQIVSETHPFTILYDNGNPIEPPDETLALQNYGWYYVMNYVSSDDENFYQFGKLYFLWSVFDERWASVYVSFDESVPSPDDYSYYFDAKQKTLWHNDGGKWTQIKDTVDNNNVVNAFGIVVRGCIRQETLIKGVAETYTWEDDERIDPGNYAFQNEYNSFWLFTTDTETNNLRYFTKDKTMWQNEDEHYILKPSEYTFDTVDFPVANELKGLIFSNIADVSGVLFPKGVYPEGATVISDNIYVYENVYYEAVLPANSAIYFYDSKNKILDTLYIIQEETTTFKIPAYGTHIRIAAPEKPSATHYVRVLDYEQKLFVKGIEYTLLPCTPQGDRNGLPNLMDRFMDLADQAYLVELPELQAAQQAIKDANTELMLLLGDLYKEGWWIKQDYVGGDEPKLYSDALENLHEVAHPETVYEFGYLDLYDVEKIGQSIEGFTDEVNWPDFDITYAAHLIDMDIDTNCWAYIDEINKCYDQPWKTTLQINTKLSNMGQQSFTDVISNIAQVSNQVKARQTIYDRASLISDSGTISASNLEGVLQANKVTISGGTSNWYTDSKGNMIFEDADGESAMMLTGRGWMISTSKDASGDWEWRTAATGKGFNADTIYTGYLSADRMEAGSITVDKLNANVGNELELGSNKALALFATSDGTRPAGSLETAHPDEGSSWISIGAATEDNPAYIAIKSGGSMILESGGTMNLEGSEINVTSGGNINVKAGGQFTIDSGNFFIGVNDQGQQVVEMRGAVTPTSGDIAGMHLAQTGNIRYMYSGEDHDDILADNPGIYIGENGINIAGKLIFTSDGTLAQANLDSGDIHIDTGASLSTAGISITQEDDPLTSEPHGYILVEPNGSINVQTSDGYNNMVIDYNGIAVAIDQSISLASETSGSSVVLTGDDIKLASSASFVELASGKIEMSNAGYVKLIGETMNGNESLIQFLNTNNDPMFKLGSMGTMQAVDIMSDNITASTLVVNNLTVNNLNNLAVPRIQYGGTQPAAGSKTYWVTPQTTLTPTNYDVSFVGLSYTGSVTAPKDRTINFLLPQTSLDISDNCTITFEIQYNRNGNGNSATVKHDFYLMHTNGFIKFATKTDSRAVSPETYTTESVTYIYSGPDITVTGLRIVSSSEDDGMCQMTSFQNGTIRFGGQSLPTDTGLCDILNRRYDYEVIYDYTRV